MSLADNPRAVKGDNEAPDFAKRVADDLHDNYGEVEKTVAALLEEARVLPKEIDNDDTKGLFSHLIKRFRELTKRLDAFRESEKDPHYRAGQAVDQFFFSMIDRCARRDKKGNPGAADVLQRRLTEYDDRVEAQKRAKLEREAAEAARVAQAARLAEAQRLREAEEARLAAERARVPEKIAEKEQVATVAEAVADTAKVEAQVTEIRADDAHIATLAKSADLMRQRDETTGTLTTRAMEKYAEVVDRNKLDYVKLAPFFNMDAVEKALRGWAANTGHTQPMEGAAIGKRPKSVVR
jgi:hypothetical protein